MVSSLASSLTIFFSILVIFSSQLSKCVATYTECDTATTAGMFPGPTQQEVYAEFIDQCDMTTTATSCTVDLTTWEEYNNFQSICNAAKGEVYELDYTTTCTSAGASSSISVVNAKQCVAPICTSEDLEQVFSQSSNGCTFSSINVVSGSSALLGEFSLRLVAVLGGIGFLMNAVI